MKKMFCSLLTITVIVTACKKENNNSNATTVDCSTVTYSGTIAGIATAKCNSAGCHAAGSANGDLTSYAGLQAKFTSGALKQRVIVEKTMPQGSTLTDTQLKQFECWINAGAPNN